MLTGNSKNFSNIGETSSSPEIKDEYLFVKKEYSSPSEGRTSSADSGLDIKNENDPGLGDLKENPIPQSNKNSFFFFLKKKFYYSIQFHNILLILLFYFYYLFCISYQII